jgi:ABC-type proline/glycine betaine transport system ATPase subunit
MDKFCSYHLLGIVRRKRILQQFKFLEEKMKTMFMKITLDNDESSKIFTENHLVLKDGSYIQAKFLKTGDSIYGRKIKIIEYLSKN